MDRQKILLRIGMFLGGIVLAAAMALLFGLIVMALWNWLMPYIFGLPLLSYGQAWGLVLLAHILFKAGHWGGSQSSRRPHPKPEWEAGVRRRMHRRFFGEGDSPTDSPTDNSADSPDAEPSPGL